MKYLVFILFICFSTQGFAISKNKLRKLVEYCKSLDETEKSLNKYCRKLKSKGYLRETNKNQDQDLDKKVLVKKKMKTQKVVKLKKTKNGVWNVYASGSILGNVNGIQGEIAHRWQNFELGLFYRNIDRTNEDETIATKGSNYGLALRYHFKPLRYTWHHRTFDPAVFLKIGNSEIEDSFTLETENYLHTTVGADFSYPLFNIGSSRLKGYSHIGIHYVHQEESFHFGSDLGLGILLEF